MRKAGSLLDLALRDAAHARDNLERHPRHAAFSVAQAAEKMIKAVLVAETVAYPATSHQLDDLVRRLPADNPFKGDFLELTGLSAAATRYRYPTAGGDVPADPDMAEMEKDLHKVELLLPEVREWIADR